MINRPIKPYSYSQVDHIKTLRLYYNQKLNIYENMSIYKNHFGIICSLLKTHKRL